MRVEASQQATPLNAGDFADEFARQRDAGETAAPKGRALVVTEIAEAPPSPVYREAAFLAHLIATKELMPQTRERRRAEPSEAIAAYQNVGALMRL